MVELWAINVGLIHLRTQHTDRVVSIGIQCRSEMKEMIKHLLGVPPNQVLTPQMVCELSFRMKSSS